MLVPNPVLVPVGTTLLWGRDSISPKESVLILLFSLTQSVESSDTQNSEGSS